MFVIAILVCLSLVLIAAIALGAVALVAGLTLGGSVAMFYIGGILAAAIFTDRFAAIPG